MVVLLAFTCSRLGASYGNDSPQLDNKDTFGELKLADLRFIVIVDDVAPRLPEAVPLHVLNFPKGMVNACGQLDRLDEPIMRSSASYTIVEYTFRNSISTSSG